MEQEFPLIHGQYCSWAEVKASAEIFGGDSFATKDFSAIDWDDALTPGLVRGTGPRVIGRTVGEYESNASVSMYYAKSVAFERKLALRNPKIGLVVWDLVVSWSPLDGEGEVFTVKLLGARIAGRAVSNAPGPDATVKSYPLSILSVIDNGISLV